MLVKIKPESRAETSDDAAPAEGRTPRKSDSSSEAPVSHDASSSEGESELELEEEGAASDKDGLPADSVSGSVREPHELDFSSVYAFDCDRREFYRVEPLSLHGVGADELVDPVLRFKCAPPRRALRCLGRVRVRGKTGSSGLARHSTASKPVIAAESKTCWRLSAHVTCVPAVQAPRAALPARLQADRASAARAGHGARGRPAALGRRGRHGRDRGGQRATGHRGARCHDARVGRGQAERNG